MSDGSVHDPRVASIGLVNGLIRRGQELKEHLTPNTQNTQNPERQVFSASSANSAWDLSAMRIWQTDCAAAINELSGGSKAHWLSRAYSAALLVRSTSGDAPAEADVSAIVRRVLDVLEQGRQALVTLDPAAPVPAEEQEPHRFDFVHDAQLRPVLEQAFIDSRRAFEEKDYERALKTASGIIEAIITDALVRLTAFAKATAVKKPDAPYGQQPDLQAMSFSERIAAVEQAGLIRGSCARLPAAARTYRDADQPASVSERDASVTRQVLRVVMRDLDPGR